MTVAELYQNIDGNYESALRIMMNDALISRFIMKLPAGDSFQKLQDAMAANDAAGIFESTHALKGVCGNLGLNRLSAMAGDLCEEFRPGRPRRLSDAEVAERMRQLEALYRQTVEQIHLFALQ